MDKSPVVYQFALDINKDSVEWFVDILSGVSSFAVDMAAVNPKDATCRIVIYGDEEPADWAKPLQAAAAATGIDLPLIKPEPVPDRDWVVESQKANPEIRAGRFFIYGSHYDGVFPSGKTYNMKIDASTAFGTGQHETTKGCLLIFDELLKSEAFDNVLDLGCGTAILAMAAAAVGTRSVLATDIDPEAVRVSKNNLKINQLQSKVRTLVSNGFDNREISRSGLYDLIFANILARPLVGLALPLARNLVSGGYVILAGLLVSQEQMVLSAYQSQKLQVVKRLHLNEWSILLMKKG